MKVEVVGGKRIVTYGRHGETKYVYYADHAERTRRLRAPDDYPDEFHFLGSIIKRVKPLAELKREDFPLELRGELPLALAACDVSIKEALPKYY